MVAWRMVLALAATTALGGMEARAAAPDVAMDPQRVCNALQAEGMPTSTWTAFDDPFEGIIVRNFRCLSEPLLIRGGGGRFITALNYFAEGRVTERVETIRLVLNVHQPATREPGRQRFSQLVSALFGNLGLTAPAELASAVRDGRDGIWRADYGTVRFENWKAPIERVRLSIILTPARRRP